MKIWDRSFPFPIGFAHILQTSQDDAIIGRTMKSGFNEK
jgi:hypothetical protein